MTRCPRRAPRRRRASGTARRRRRRHGRLWVADFGHSRLKLFDREGGYLGGWGGRGEATSPSASSAGSRSAGRTSTSPTPGTGESSSTRSGESCGPRPGSSTAPAASPPPRTDRSSRRTPATIGSSVMSGISRAPAVDRSEGLGPRRVLLPCRNRGGPVRGIYVADTGNRRIQVLGRRGRFRRFIPFPGWKGAVEPHLEVERGRSLRQRPGRGRRLRVFADGDGSPPVGDGRRAPRISRPTGLARDAKNRILYVVNSGNDSISKIEPDQKEKR